MTFFLAACGENLTHPEPDAYDPGDAPALECLPNLDGRIDRAELVVAFDVPVSFLVSPEGTQRAVDLAGRIDASGRRVWDWSQNEPDDQLARIEAEPVAGKWYEADFDGGELVLPVELDGRLEGVYAIDDQALWLLGIASAEPEPPEGRTLLVYEEPVALYTLPIEPGQQWVAVGEVRDGLLLGLPYAGRDVYEVEVVQTGRILLPDLTFTQVHQVHTRVVVEPAVGAPTSRRQVSFLAECFGEVARATSLPDEPSQDFDVAAEVRRLSLLR